MVVSISSCCVSYLFHSAPLLERMFYRIITAGEYLFLLPGISASVEVLGYSQNSLAVFVHALQLIAYFILNKFTTKVHFTWRHYTSFFLIIIAIVLVI